MKMKKKFKISIVILLIIAVGAIGFYIFKNKNEETIKVDHQVSSISSPVSKVYTTNANSFKIKVH